MLSRSGAAVGPYPPPAKGAGRYFAVLLLALLAIYVAYAASVTPMLYWNAGDSVHYLHHAEQLANGQPYSDTDYLPNAPAARIGPQNYPPGYPALLAVGHKAFTGDIENIKRVALLVWPLFLLVFYALARWVLSPAKALIATLVVAVNSIFWRWHDLLVSELLFLLLIVVALYLYEWHAARRQILLPAQESWPARIGIGLLLGLAIAAAYSSRSLAVLLFPTFIVADLWRLRRLQWTTVVALLVAALAMLWQELALGAIDAYGEIVEAGKQQLPLLQQLFGRTKRILQGLMSFMGWRLPSVVAIAILLPVLLFSAVGAARLLLKKQLVAPVVYAGGTLAMLMLLPFGQDARRLSGMVPLLAIFAVVGYQFVADTTQRKQLIAIFGSVLLLAYIAATGYDISRFATEKVALIEQDSQRSTLAKEAYAYVSQLPEGSRVLFRYPRRMAFYSSVATSGFSPDLSLVQLQSIIDTQRLNYLVEDRADESMVLLKQLYEAYPDRFEPLWSNDRFSVLRIDGGVSQPGPQ